MKRNILYKLFIICFISSINVTNAQVSTSTIYKNWTVLAESSNSIDVSYKIMKCENAATQIFFSIFNESGLDQEVKFTITIQDNVSTATFSKDIVLDTKKMNIYKADCSSEPILDALKFNLPQSYDPDHLTLSISFK